MVLPMASPSQPPSIDNLGDRRFSFYPPIVGIERNEWISRQTTWSEMHVFNPAMNLEVWIPRSYLGEISKVEEPVMIIGLKRELEYKGGSVWPFQRRVLEMPANPIAAKGLPPRELPKMSVMQSLRLNDGAESGVTKLLATALTIFLVVTVAGITVYKMRSTGGRVEYQGILQMELGFTAQTDYYDVVRKLGPPEQDRYREDTGERQYRLLAYPKHDLIIILMGADRGTERYIGAKNSNWRTVHAVTLPGGANTEPILRALKRF
jgi:hypothetical protein